MHRIWIPSAPTGFTYTLEEATSADFTTGKRVAYTATANTVSIIGRIKAKTYYYRVKANKSGWASSGWVTGGNGCKIGI